mmetsp:Transcript_66858/g.204742  ORF Transcript_66858/g.204742 Transcript_66858/m.204742 type:complete len:478 (+) Transcript_66858:6441-7874(+)
MCLRRNRLHIRCARNRIRELAADDGCGGERLQDLHFHRHVLLGGTGHGGRVEACQRGRQAQEVLRVAGPVHVKPEAGQLVARQAANCDGRAWQLGKPVPGHVDHSAARERADGWRQGSDHWLVRDRRGDGGVGAALRLGKQGDIPQPGWPGPHDALQGVGRRCASRARGRLGEVSAHNAVNAEGQCQVLCPIGIPLGGGCLDARNLDGNDLVHVYDGWRKALQHRRQRTAVREGRRRMCLRSADNAVGHDSHGQGRGVIGRRHLEVVRRHAVEHCAVILTILNGHHRKLVVFTSHQRLVELKRWDVASRQAEANPHVESERWATMGIRPCFNLNSRRLTVRHLAEPVGNPSSQPIPPPLPSRNFLSPLPIETHAERAVHRQACVLLQSNGHRGSPHLFDRHADPPRRSGSQVAIERDGERPIAVGVGLGHSHVVAIVHSPRVLTHAQYLRVPDERLERRRIHVGPETLQNVVAPWVA